MLLGNCPLEKLDAGGRRPRLTACGRGNGSNDNFDLPALIEPGFHPQRSATPAGRPGVAAMTRDLEQSLSEIVSLPTRRPRIWLRLVRARVISNINSSLWHMGFIGWVNPIFKLRVSTLLPVLLVLLGPLGIAAHAPRIDRSIRITGEHRHSLKLDQESRALFLRDASKPCQLFPVRSLAFDEQRAAWYSYMHQCHHLHPKPASCNRAATQSLVRAPIGRIEFHPRLFQASIPSAFL